MNKFNITEDIIDAHQHFWEYNAEKHSWIDDKMNIIKNNFLPKDFEAILQRNNILGTIAVQADQTEFETNFLLQLANKYTFIKGIVGWTDLTAYNITDRLDFYNQFTEIKGFRHVLQDENPSFILQSSFLNGIKALNQTRFTYDILVYPKHLSNVSKLVKKFPNQAFVIDHIAKPNIKIGEISQWKKDIEGIAHFENVYCKISGLVTETDYKKWKIADFTPYLDVVVESFGTNRIMFGSDWPVSLVSAKYPEVLGIVKSYFDSFSKEEKYFFFRKNAELFYQLNI